MNEDMPTFVKIGLQFVEGDRADGNRAAVSDGIALTIAVGVIERLDRDLKFQVHLVQIEAGDDRLEFGAVRLVKAEPVFLRKEYRLSNRLIVLRCCLLILDGDRHQKLDGLLPFLDEAPEGFPSRKGVD